MLVPFEILSHYPSFDSSHWFIKNVRRIIDEELRETRVV